MSIVKQGELGITTNHQSNNFDFLRFVAAFFVVFGHSFALLNLMKIEPLIVLSNGGLYSGTLGVYIFFVISGYLILSSWDRNPVPIKFLKTGSYEYSRH